MISIKGGRRSTTIFPTFLVRIDRQLQPHQRHRTSRSRGRFDDPVRQNTYQGRRVVKQTFGGTNASGVPAGGDFLFCYSSASVEQPVWEAFNPETQAMESFQATSMSLRINPSGSAALFVFDEMGNDRVRCDFTGRIDPTGLDPSSHNISTFVDFTGPRLKTSAPGYEAPIRAGVDPDCYFTYKLVNSSGLITHLTTPGSQKLFHYDTDGLPYARANLLRIDELDTEDSTSRISTVYAYEPLFNLLRATYHARGLDPLHTPPNGGVNSPDRYRTLRRFDYEEGGGTAGMNTSNWILSFGQTDTLARLATWGISLGPVQLGQGDLNGDGIVGQSHGNVVLVQEATARIYADLDDPTQGYADQSSETMRSFNDFSLLTREVDPEGNTTDYEYFGELDPDGDGTPTLDPSGALDGTTGTAGGGGTSRPATALKGCR